MDRTAWDAWWRSRGEDRLTLLLWALWNPIGPVPLNEYAGYAGRLVSVLGRARTVDATLLLGGHADERQLEDNHQWAASVEELASHLARERTTMMEVPLDPAVERHAAEVLLAWYE
jgi:hypothetical protein